jgi:hypothetical protein
VDQEASPVSSEVGNIAVATAAAMVLFREVRSLVAASLDALEEAFLVAVAFEVASFPKVSFH